MTTPTHMTTHTHQLLFSMLLNLDSPKAEAKVTRRAVRTIRNLQTGSTPLTSEIPYAYLQLWAHRQLSRSGHIPPVSTSVHLAHTFRSWSCKTGKSFPHHSPLVVRPCSPSNCVGVNNMKRYVILTASVVFFAHAHNTAHSKSGASDIIGPLAWYYNIYQYAAYRVCERLRYVGAPFFFSRCTEMTSP